MEVIGKLKDTEVMEIIREHFKRENIGHVTGIYKEAHDTTMKVKYETFPSSHIPYGYDGGGPGGRD